MSQTQLPTDLYVGGSLSCKTFAPPAGCIGDSAVEASPGAGLAIQASKLQQQYTKTYSQPGASNAAVERKVVHVVEGATATIQSFQVGARVAAIGAATATIDLQVNGTSILTATISLTSATAAYALVTPAGYTSTSLTQGNVVEVVVSAATAGGGTLAQGLFAQVEIREDPQ